MARKTYAGLNETRAMEIASPTVEVHHCDTTISYGNQVLTFYNNMYYAFW